MFLIQRFRSLFRTIKPQDYLLNQRESIHAQRPHLKTLYPLQGANHGENANVSDEVQLVGVPKGQDIETEIDIFERLLIRGDRDLLFLQIDPSPYIARQRFQSHRCALGQVQDYRMDGIHMIDPHKAITWEQAVVNLNAMDMMRTNQLPKEFNLKKGLYTYSYPYLQEAEDSKALTSVFIQDIGDKILEGNRTGYNLIEKVLYTGLMGKQKIMLGGMPETLFRMILGKALSIHQTRDIFRTVVLKNKELTIPMAVKDATITFMPHIFQMPKDLYMTANIKETFQAAMQMLAFVGIEHWRPMQHYWVSPPHGINMTQASRIPEGFPGETSEDLIEKQAILDVLLESRLWSKGYLSNPFPYLFEDITKVQQKQLSDYRSTFLRHYKKYKEFLKRESKALPAGEPTPLQLSEIKQQKEQLEKMKGAFSGSPTLSHLNNTAKFEKLQKIRLKG